MARDTTKYGIKGEGVFYPKSRLVLRVLKQFFQDVVVSEHPNSSWPDSLQGNLGVITALSEVVNTKYYFTDFDELVTDANGVDYVVCNQWGKENFEVFIQHCSTMGYPIIKESDEVEPSKETFNLKLRLQGDILRFHCCMPDDMEKVREEQRLFENICFAFWSIDNDSVIQLLDADTDEIYKELDPSTLVVENLEQNQEDDAKILESFQEIYNDGNLGEFSLEDSEMWPTDLYRTLDGELFFCTDNFASHSGMVKARKAAGLALRQKEDGVLYSFVIRAEFLVESEPFRSSRKDFKNWLLIEIPELREWQSKYNMFSWMVHPEAGNVELVNIIDSRPKDMYLVEGWVTDY